jgi:NAD(P)-dependent dehydrogenase (short-subunit alcohol dehydrogenase family)
MQTQPADSGRSLPQRGAVLVTGASSGIGRACALNLAAAGFRVFAGVRAERDAELLRAAAPQSLTPLLLDVTDTDQLSAAASLLTAELRTSGLQGLINNAGICVTGPLEYVPLRALRQQLEVNVVAQVAVTQAVLPLLRIARGRIVNIGSTSGRIAGRLVGPYCASKFALEAVTSALRLELQSSGVAVSIVEPGVVATAFWAKALAAEHALVLNLPPDGSQRYGEALARRRDKMTQFSSTGCLPEAVCNAIFHALTARRPKLRYVVGMDAKLRTTLAAVLPEWLWHYLVAGRGSA